LRVVFLTFRFSSFLGLFKRDFRLKKEANALHGGPRRLADRAVKGAMWAFIGASEDP
jgi:hypothetical protein